MCSCRVSSRGVGEMSDPPIEVDDLLILLLGASGGRAPGVIEGITRLEKLAFLIEQEAKPAWLSEPVGFAADKFGPFSSKVYTAVDTLAAADLITDSSAVSPTTEDSWETGNIIGGDVGDPYASRTFTLTDLGRRYYDALVSELPAGAEQQLSEFKSTFATIPLRQLIRYVYQGHPSYTVNSIIREDVLK